MTENNRVEYKRELTGGLEKEVVAFLNAREGGLLYIGLDDDGKAVGEAGRFSKFTLSQIKARNYNLDICWLKDDSLEDPNALPEPQVLAGDAITKLNACVDELQEILALIESEETE